MTRANRCFRFLAAVLALVIILPGCATMKKVAGSYEAYLQAPPDRVVAALRQALDELQLTHVSSSASKLDGEVRARTARGQNVTIKVKTQGQGVSKMTVRVGVLGDGAVSEAIIAETEKRLSAARTVSDN